MSQTKIETSRRQSDSLEAVDVVLPAGGRIAGEFARISGQDIKALISLQDKTVLRRTIATLETLRAAGRVGKIVAVGPEAAQREARDAGADAALPEGGSGPDNFFRGMDALEPRSSGSRVLIVATDLPFLTADSVSRFLDACPRRADVAVPVISRAAMERRFPGLPGAYVPLREGPVTTGCVFLVNPDALRRNRAHIEAIFAARKNQIAMARLLGAGFLIKYALRRLAVGDIEAQCRRILDCSGAAILDSSPELAFDMDTPEEYQYAKAHAAEIENADHSEEADYARR